jgi:hypothetical protein
MVTAGLIALVAMFPANAVRAQGDLRPSVVEVEWQTATGYERCAAVVVGRTGNMLEAWTAGHCAEHPYSIVRFFDGHAMYGSGIRVLERSDTIDAALLGIPVEPARARNTPAAVRARTVPPLGSALTIIGHPVAALRAPNAGRWTVTAARMGETEPDQQTGALEYEVYCGRCGPGDSGSGVFDSAGHFVGLVYGVTEIANVAGGRLPDGLYADVIPAGTLR